MLLPGESKQFIRERAVSPASTVALAVRSVVGETESAYIHGLVLESRMVLEEEICSKK